MQIVDQSNSEHYSWGIGCDGWHLLKREDLSIITERFPPGANEQLHRHLHLLHFFYILTGEAVIKIDGVKHILQAQQSIEIPPGVYHQLCNESISDVMFLTISIPKAYGDRIGTIKRFTD
jgi:mannose-6-phosphate isomerase-like protein (cupin superfamily)